MTATPKYKAKAVFFDLEREVVVDVSEVVKHRKAERLKLPGNIVRFASQHEFKVYLELCRIYGANRVARQVPVQIYPKGYCYPNGKVWRVDFAITSDDSSQLPVMYIEAKGAFLPEFGFTLAALEQLQPDVFDDLYVVFGACIPKFNKIVSALLNSDFNYRLLTLEKLKCLQYLPLPL